MRTNSKGGGRKTTRLKARRTWLPARRASARSALRTVPEDDAKRGPHLLPSRQAVGGRARGRLAAQAKPAELRARLGLLDLDALVGEELDEVLERGRLRALDGAADLLDRVLRVVPDAQERVVQDAAGRGLERLEDEVGDRTLSLPVLSRRRAAPESATGCDGLKRVAGVGRTAPTKAMRPPCGSENVTSSSSRFLARG